MKVRLLHYAARSLFYNILFRFAPSPFFLLLSLHLLPVLFASCLISTLPSTSSQVWPLPPLLSTIHTSLSDDPTLFFLLLFFNRSFISFASFPLHLSCGPNSPITAGGNYAWKVIRCSLNNYPLMQLIDFPFQELCFLSPGSAFLSLS